MATTESAVQTVDNTVDHLSRTKSQLEMIRDKKGVPAEDLVEAFQALADATEAYADGDTPKAISLSSKGRKLGFEASIKRANARIDAIQNHELADDYIARLVEGMGKDLMLNPVNWAGFEYKVRTAEERLRHLEEIRQQRLNRRAALAEAGLLATPEVKPKVRNSRSADKRERDRRETLELKASGTRGDSSKSYKTKSKSR